MKIAMREKKSENILTAWRIFTLNDKIRLSNFNNASSSEVETTPELLKISIWSWLKVGHKEKGFFNFFDFSLFN
jgi:hypothetical protein